MPKGSETLTNARKEEILNACAKLYESMGFRDITIRDIGKETSFTRTSIYNYFQTKEEIFLALLQREHEAWKADLLSILSSHEALSPEGFAEELAASLEKRGCMLKLMSMNLYDMEGSSRMENLVAFKKVYADVLRALDRCLRTFFPAMTEQERQEFRYSFFPLFIRRLSLHHRYGKTGGSHGAGRGPSRAVLHPGAGPVFCKKNAAVLLTGEASAGYKKSTKTGVLL